MNVSVQISVVIPLFNKAPFVVEAIESVLQQSYQATEIIVIDDGSTDSGPDLVRRMNAPRLRIISQPNAGVSAARNRGIDTAAGDYVAFLDADDRYQPDFLAKIAELFARFPDAGMACTAYTCFWDGGHREDRCIRAARSGELMYVQDFYSAWSKSTFTTTSAIVIARRLLGSTRLCFPAGEKLGEDQDLWFRVAEAAPVVYANISLTDYRMGVPGSATQNSAVQDVLPCYQRLGERLMHNLVPTRLKQGARRLLANHLLSVARANLVAGNGKKAAMLLTDRRVLANPVSYFRTLVALALFAVRAEAKS